MYSADDDFTELANPAERLEELLTRYFIAFITRQKIITVTVAKKKIYTCRFIDDIAPRRDRILTFQV